ncbi:MAG: RagB/SusD family nutrient uptake outer membrane protein [Paludibacteraceae bacterium]|nr:RagB/SusD family nutrient uptake outer membrane protein [Paludibacteraceae bacterium]
MLAVAAFSLTACVDDLNTKPIDTHSSTSFNQQRMFTKCYATLGLIGQSLPTEDSDVEDMDAGTSSFYRTAWYCNDLTTDEAWWIHDDEESIQIRSTSWTGNNAMVRGIYTRMNIDVKYYNHYISNASTSTQDEKYCMAEVRFLRALHYFYIMDMFLYAPFCISESSDYPHFKPRHEIYKWLVSELNELIGELPEKRLSLYRVDKCAAQLLLARVYLNADVYNKYNPTWTANSNETWKRAADMADMVINNSNYNLFTGPALPTDSDFVYSTYQQLFMGDNNRPDVAKEFPLLIYQDGVYCRSYGGMMLVSAMRDKGMTAWGTEEQWNCIRTSPTMVDKFLKTAGLSRSEAKAIKLDEYHMPARLGDDRAIMCSYAPGTDKKEFGLSGNQTHDDTKYFYDCWAAPKFTAVYSTASLPSLSPRQDATWPDNDIPLFRVAEAYLIKAEAMFRQGNIGEAKDLINNTIRKRANAGDLVELDEETLLDEWCREFFFEGRRRIDLIRFGRFYGPQSDQYQYNWEGRLQTNDNAPFVSGSDEHWNWFPIPSEDKMANPNFRTDVMNDKNNPFASPYGDGYSFTD